MLLLAFALIAANGFFVGAEFAVLAARRPRLEPPSAWSRRARTALHAFEQLPLMISACQFGITLASLGLGALGEPVVANFLVGPFHAAGLPEQLVRPISLAIALTIVSALHMLLGEMVPKNLALAGPERAALLLTPPLLAFVRLFRPIITSLTALATAVVRLLRITPASEVSEAADRDAVAALIAESGSHGLLRADQQALLSAALAHEEKTADSVKTVSGPARSWPDFLLRSWSQPRLAPAASPGAPDPLVQRVFNQVEATFRKPVSAGDVARALGYTPGHLTTVVRERTGRPLLEWITERRMTEVRRMLRETDLPLGVVAARTGLRDATYLVRRFRDRYGITPQRWRRIQHTWP